MGDELELEGVYTQYKQVHLCYLKEYTIPCQVR